MSNWCTTSWALKGPKEAIERLNDILKSLKPSAAHKRPWLPDVMKAAGADLPEDQDRRSEFVSWNEYRDVFIATTEDANTTKLEAMASLAKACGFTKTLYLSECFENDIFETNDKDREYFRTKYALDLETDIRNDIEPLTYFDSEEELLSFLEEKFGLEYNSAYDVEMNLENDFFDMDEDAFCSFHEIVYSDELKG